MTSALDKRLREARDELARIEGEMGVLTIAWKGTLADMEARLSLTIRRLRYRVRWSREALDEHMAQSTGREP